MRQRKLNVFLFFSIVLTAIVCCKKESDEIAVQETFTNDTGTQGIIEGYKGDGLRVIDVLMNKKTFHSSTDDCTWDASAETIIELTENSFTATGQTVKDSANILTITHIGDYRITGSNSNIQIRVETAEKGTVRLILDGANFSCSNSAPIYVANAKNTVIILADGSENKISDTEHYVFSSSEEDEPNATIFSKDDLTFCGTGSLSVTANYNNAIVSKDGLVIKNGNITVTSVDDGIKGKDYLVVLNGTITVDAKGDGLKSSNDSDSQKGYILIEGGAIDITAGADALQAETDFLADGGTVTVNTAGGSSASISDSETAKGIKAGSSIIIDGGNFTFNTADDAIHSNTYLVINGGDFSLASADDAIHADSLLEINDGTIDIIKSYEGIESATVVINGGNINLIASDDGVNSAGGGGSEVRPTGGFDPMAASSGDYFLYINGGELSVNSSGDGLDVNGTIVMTGGKVVVEGPTANDNGALDYDGAFVISGGSLIATGSAGMAQSPSSSSSQYSVIVYFTSAQPAGTETKIIGSNGNTLLSATPAKAYQTAVFSCPELQSGAAYAVFGGGSLFKSATLSSIVTTVGTATNTGPGGPPR